MPRDLSKVIESLRRYRFANLPRSISWAEVERVLQSVDRGMRLAAVITQSSCF
jgi:integrase